MYLMKLKNDRFGSEAAACWRQLFVVSLMPWMMKLRVFSDKRLERLSMEHYNARRLERISSSSVPMIPVNSPSPKMSYRVETHSLLGEVMEEDEEEMEPFQA